MIIFERIISFGVVTATMRDQYGSYTKTCSVELCSQFPLEADRGGEERVVTLQSGIPVSQTDTMRQDWDQLVVPGRFPSSLVLELLRIRCSNNFGLCNR